MTESRSGPGAACWLGDRLLLAVVAGEAPWTASAGSLQVSTPDGLGSDTIAVEMLLSRTASTDGDVISVVLLRLADAFSPGSVTGALRMGRGRVAGGGRWAAGWDVVIDEDDAAGSVCRAGPAALPSAERAKLLEAVVTSIQDEDRSIDVQRRLRGLRDCLREQLVPIVVDPASPISARVEVLARIDPHRVYVRGWVGDLSQPLTRLTLVAPTGDRTAIVGAHRFRRSDIADFYGIVDSAGDLRAGFAAVATFERRADLSDGWFLEVALSGASAEGEDACVPVLEPMEDVRRILIGDLVLDEEPERQMSKNHLAPALATLQERHRSLTRIEAVDQWGAPPAAPTATIIVPLYGRLDFMEHQLAQFAHDPEISSADLIYVLDSPELKDSFRGMAGRLHRLYRVPFRAVVLNRNAGFSGANNAGASLARGRLLVLMNSDVLPRERGWLGQMTSVYDRRPNCGALGVKLLFEDDTVQHAGMFFERFHEGDLWANDHVYKGVHRTLPAVTTSRPVPAVTAALLMVSGERYAEVGGLRGDYIQGDYEDSDMCLRLGVAGYENWYEASIELYHLEGQSYPSPLRVMNGNFNRWLHTRNWGDRIAEIMAG